VPLKVTLTRSPAVVDKRAVPPLCELLEWVYQAPEYERPASESSMRTTGGAVAVGLGVAPEVKTSNASTQTQRPPELELAAPTTSTARVCEPDARSVREKRTTWLCSSVL
jgi:hypothetical protein